MQRQKEKQNRLLIMLKSMVFYIVSSILMSSCAFLKIFQVCVGDGILRTENGHKHNFLELFDMVSKYMYQCIKRLFE